jgi:nitroreductase
LAITEDDTAPGARSTIYTSVTHPKHAPTDHEIVPLIRERWSPRAYLASKPVDSDTLWRLFEAARWAPSSRNEQPWRFVVVRRHDEADVHEKVVQALSTGNQAWAPLAPLLLVVAVKLHVGDNADVNRHAYYDTGHAVALLTIQAQAMGLGVRQMEGFDRSAVTTLIGMPADYEAAVVMAVGYPTTPDVLSVEKQRASETAPRTRRPASEFVFAGSWGRSLSARV